uniref:Uncharacterized protein n=1 Tax=Malurus cyaneus samueli TaxID=2593467 RepID=A0A8C5TJV8_9PASS
MSKPCLSILLPTVRLPALLFLLPSHPIQIAKRNIHSKSLRRGTARNNTPPAWARQNYLRPFFFVNGLVKEKSDLMFTKPEQHWRCGGAGGLCSIFPRVLVGKINNPKPKDLKNFQLLKDDIL